MPRRAAGRRVDLTVRVAKLKTKKLKNDMADLKYPTWALIAGSIFTSVVRARPPRDPGAILVNVFHDDEGAGHGEQIRL